MPAFPSVNLIQVIKDAMTPGTSTNRVFGVPNPNPSTFIDKNTVKPEATLPQDDLLDVPQDNLTLRPPSSEATPTLPGDDRLDDNSDYSFLEYLEGLFASAGAENETNRLYNSAQAALNREFQHNESQLQRDWYEAMSSSAYQRAMKDMKAAGFNPILAYSQGGAAAAGTGVPTGSAASYNVGSGDTLSNILTSVADLVNALSGASASKIDKLFKIFKMSGG